MTTTLLFLAAIGAAVYLIFTTTVKRPTDKEHASKLICELATYFEEKGDFEALKLVSSLAAKIVYNVEAQSNDVRHK